MKVKSLIRHGIVVRLGSASVQRWSTWLIYAASVAGYITLSLFTKRFMGWNFALVYFVTSIELITWLTLRATRRRRSEQP